MTHALAMDKQRRLAGNGFWRKTVAVLIKEFIQLKRDRLSGGTPVAKAALWSDTDAETRKRGEQTGLDTLVVHAVNDGHCFNGRV